MAITLLLTPAASYATLASVQDNVYRDVAQRTLVGWPNWLGLGHPAPAACLLILVLIWMSTGLAQQLPNSPSTSRHEPAGALTSPCGSTGCWDYDHPTLSWKQTFTSKNFWPYATVWIASQVADNEVSWRGIRRGICAEGNIDLGRHPSHADYYWYSLYTNGPQLVIGAMMVKLNRRPTNWMFRAVAAVNTAYHIDGMNKWARSGCL